VGGKDIQWQNQAQKEGRHCFFTRIQKTKLRSFSLRVTIHVEEIMAKMMGLFLGCVETRQYLVTQ